VYCGTYNVIFIQNGDEPPKVRTGDYLGHLTHELEELAVSLLLENVCRVDQRTMRCKFSAPRQENVQTKWKVKGTTLNYEN